MTTRGKDWGQLVNTPIFFPPPFSGNYWSRPWNWNSEAPLHWQIDVRVGLDRLWYRGDLNQSELLTKVGI